MRGRWGGGAEGTGPAGAARFRLPRSKGSACMACDTTHDRAEFRNGADSASDRQQCSGREFVNQERSSTLYV